MENKKNIFDFISQILCNFAITIVLFIILCSIFGETSKEISTMFELGSKGISVTTMLQLLLSSFLIVLEKNLFITNLWIKKMSYITRIILLLISVAATVSVLICIFKWFPVGMWQPWALFLLCFAVCFIAGTVVMTVKTNMDNKKMEKALTKLKEQWKDEEDGQ